MLELKRMKIKLPRIQNKKGLILALGFTLIMISLICILYQYIGNKVPYQDAIRMNDGWDVSINDEEYENISLSDFSFHAVGNGDVVTMENVLPDKLVTEPTLRILVYHSAVDVAIDGRSIYQYGADHMAEGRMVGSGFHYVILPEDAAGSNLQIQFHATEADAFTTFESILIETNGKIITDFIYENRMALCISIFLIVFGCILVLIAAFAQFYHREFQWLFWVSLFSIAIGVWISCNYNLIQLFSQDYCVNNLIEYTALYLAPLPIMIFFFEISKELRFERTIFCVLSICSGLFLAISLMLHALNVLHMPTLLPVFQGLLVAYIPFTLIAAARHIKDTNRMLRIISIGVAALALFSLTDLLRFNVQKYIDRDFMEGIVSFLPIGTLIFVTSLIISYCVSLVDHMYVKAERELLLKMAYSDELTHIHNRAKCEEVLQELEYGGDGYAILSLDLNNLKQINDSLGHACGDRLLKDFAAILVKVFAVDGTVGRMGGDEFIVVLPRISKVRLQGRVEFMEQMMDKQNIREKDIRLSVAWGYAFSTECAGGDSEAVYELADKRMYKMKRRMKEEGLITDR